MLKMSKPRRATKSNSAKWHQKVSDLERLIKYCETDVEAETELFLANRPLIESERKLWLLDQKINWRGVRVDRPLIARSLDLIDQASKQFLIDAKEITGGEVNSVAQRDATLRFLKSQGLELPDLTSKTVADTLARPEISGKIRELLQLRADASKTSTAKFQAFESRSKTTGRIYDTHVYHAASTGRFAGSGVQVHNFPKPVIGGNTDLAADIVLDPKTDLAWLAFLYRNPLDVLSSILRSCIIPSPGKIFFGGDFAGIEVRVLFWIAGHTDGVQAYIDGRDLYKEIATAIYRVELSEVTKEQREIGKRAILGCGYSMGAPKFQLTCKNFGVEISEEVAKTAVMAYRETHYPVKILWSNLERAAIAAVKNVGKKYYINKTQWWVEDRYLFCKLPSGRKLAYFGPEIRFVDTPWGDKKETLYHYDVHPKTKKWVLTGTYGGRICENVVQATARDIMTDAMIRCEDAGYEIQMTVHDELLTEKETGSEKEFEKLMAEVPKWAEGCPIGVGAWSGYRYRK